MLLIDKTHDEWANLSGLTPKQNFSMADHAYQAYKLGYPNAVMMSLNDFLATGEPPEPPEEED